MSAEPTDKDLQRLGRAVYERRERLRLTQAEVHERGGPSDTKVGQIENGARPVPSGRTLRNIDRALDWEDGSAWGVLHEGITPTPKRTTPRLRALGDTAPLTELLTPARDLGGGPLRRLLEIRGLVDIAIEELRSQNASE